MKEIRKGSDITPAKLRALMTKVFQFANEADPTTLHLTTGQFVEVKTSSKKEDVLSMYSDQYFQTDILPDQFAGEDVSFLQKYKDKLTKIKEGD